MPIFNVSRLCAAATFILLYLAMPLSADILPASDDRYLLPQDISSLDARSLRIARNEIYARHGYIFQSSDLARHFSTYSWYRPRTRNVTLSAVEQNNVDLIKQREAELSRGVAMPRAMAGSRAFVPGTFWVGSWFVVRKRDPMIDVPIVNMIRITESGSNIRGSGGALSVLCHLGETKVYVNWSAFMGPVSSTVTHRVGNAAPVRLNWTLSDKQDATFYPGDASSFVRSWLGETHVVFRATPYMSSPITLIFDTSDFVTAYSEVASTCGW